MELTSAQKGLVDSMSEEQAAAFHDMTDSQILLLLHELTPNVVPPVPQIMRVPADRFMARLN